MVTVAVAVLVETVLADSKIVSVALGAAVVKAAAVVAAVAVRVARQSRCSAPVVAQSISQEEPRPKVPAELAVLAEQQDLEDPLATLDRQASRSADGSTGSRPHEWGSAALKPVARGFESL